MNKAFNFIERNILNLFLTFLIVLNLLPILAPLAAHFGLTGISSAIYSVYSYFCHQRAWRSIHIFDFQYAWCVRDTFIYLSLLLSLLVTKYTNIKSLKWYFVILLTIPIALDGGIQTIAEILDAGKNVAQFYESNDLFRMITGTLFGLGVGFWMWPSLKDSFQVDKVADVSKEKLSIIARMRIFLGNSLLKTIFSLFVFNFVLYLTIVGIWNVTSPTHKPSNFLDSDSKTKTNQEDRCKRAEDSTNPLFIALPGCGEK
ncbi:MAG: DUF2085 domain-containing protein [bacterium]